MADNKKGTIIAVSVISLLLVGTAIFFVVKGAGLKPRPQDDDKDDKDDKDTKGNKQKADNTATSTTGSQLSDFFVNMRDKIAGGLKTKDPSTFEGFTFPIKRGQKGNNVKRLQQLLLTFDKNILPKFGADGDFGGETEVALEKIIGKKRIDNQDDIKAIETKIKQKAGTLMTGSLLNQQLGIKLF